MNDPDFRRRLRETFQAEASEHLRALSHETFALEKTDALADHQAIVEKIFRETHTLKGAARMVGELDAESLCHSFEQKLSGLKHSGQRVPRDLIAELHDNVSELSRSLGIAVELTPAPVATPSESVPTKENPSTPSSGQIRVPGARLDALLLRAEEMVSAKLTNEENVATLRSITDRGGAWKKEIDRVRPDLAALRRFIDSGESSPIAKEVSALLHYLDWNQEFLRAWSLDLSKLTKTVHADQRRLGSMIGSLLEETKEILTQPFSSLLETFPAFVRETAQRQGKDIELIIVGEQTEIDRRVLEEIRDALIHLVRNSIDHGIETAAERRAAGKPAKGTLTIAVRDKSGGIVEVTVSDDGRGIDPAVVTASAQRLGLIGADAPELNSSEALAFLFRSGFSTKQTATELSGRGVGLAVVREKAEHIGGTVSVESTPQRGAIFHLQVPLTLARFRGLFVSAQRHLFVVPAPYVRRVVRVQESELKAVKNQILAEIDGESVVVLALKDVLGISTPSKKNSPPQNQPAFLLLIESGHSHVALRVDEVPVEEEIVMKNLGHLLRGARHYVGATIVAGGQIVPVLNVTNLLESTVRRRAPQHTTASAKPKERRKRTVLIAEDSITSRSLLKSILQAAGFEVRTAVDGADAFTMLKYEPVDLVISDVQMPRMDGFELTAKIRADPALSTLPLILITSLASREDKARGVDAGANAYIVKSSFDQSDLLAAMGRLLP